MVRARPWWRWTSTGLGGTTRNPAIGATYQRVDSKDLWCAGKPVPGGPDYVYDTRALADYDAAKPIPAPPPMPGQVWAWASFAFGHGRLAETMVTHVNVADGSVRWATGGKHDLEHWPPHSAILVYGPTPWGPNVPWAPSETP